MVYQALIVDDEEIVCRGLARFVKWEEHGFEVAGTAYNVNAALDFLHQMWFLWIFVCRSGRGWSFCVSFMLSIRR